MKAEVKQNFEEKLRLVNNLLLISLDANIKTMIAEHARDGLLKSGNTIKRTMDFISTENSNFYQETLTHLVNLSPRYYPALESDVLQLVATTHKFFKESALEQFQKIINLVGKQELFARMLPEIESAMANHLANFQNNLNAIVLDLKLHNHKPPLEIVLWCIEGALLLASIFIAGMWFNNPNGNYEPLLIALALIMPLIYLVIKINAKK